MGGYGSGRWPEKYFATTKDCCSVRLYGEPGKGVSPSCRIFGCRLSIAAKIDARIWWCSSPLNIFLYCTSFENQNSVQVNLVTTTPYFGGLRYWLVCPSCRRRVTKLFCLGRRRGFFCRVCQGLTYQSCRSSHDLDPIIAKTRQPGQSRAEALRKLKEFRETLLSSWGLKK